MSSQGRCSGLYGTGVGSPVGSPHVALVCDSETLGLPPSLPPHLSSTDALVDRSRDAILVVLWPEIQPYTNLFLFYSPLSSPWERSRGAILVLLWPEIQPYTNLFLFYSPLSSVRALKETQVQVKMTKESKGIFYYELGICFQALTQKSSKLGWTRWEILHE